MSRAMVPMLALAVSACGHYSFESAVTRGDGNATDGADGDSARMDALIEPGLLVRIDCEALTGNVLADASGQGSLASCATGLCPTIVSGGPRGNACLFDGIDDVVTVAPDTRFQPAMFSIAVWLRQDMAPGFYRAAWIKHGSDSSQEVWGVYAYADIGGDTLLAGGGSAGDAYTSLGAPITGTWTHVAVTFDGSAYVAYRDGVLAGPPLTAAPGDAMNELVLGAEFSASNRSSFWFGGLDDARLYDRVLSQAEITALAAL